MTRTIFSFFDGHPYFNQLYSLRDFPHFCVCPLKGVVFVLCVLLTFGAQGPMDYQGIIPASDGRERSIIRPLSCFDFEKSSGPKVVYRMHCTFQLERVIIQSSPLKVPDVYFIRRCWRELRCCHHMSTQSLGLMEIRAAGKLLPFHSARAWFVRIRPEPPQLLQSSSSSTYPTPAHSGQ